MAHHNFKTLIIANPRSANGNLGRKWSQLEAIIKLSFGPFESRFTAGQQDATALARQGIEDGYEMVVAMGGDGTISEVVDGFFTAQGPVNPEAVLGVLPFGTGGDFRKTIGAPKKLALGAFSLVGKATQEIDVGRLTYTDESGQSQVRHFINIASFGISGLVDRYVNTTTKALGGRVSFALATLRAMRLYRPQQAQITLDGGEPRQVLLHNVAVANGQYFGGGMQIAPQAQLDDGLFDVVTLAPMGFKDVLLKGHHVYRGTHIHQANVGFQRARRVEALPATPNDLIHLDVDGETPGRLPATFELLPRALRLKTPQT